MIHPVAFKSSLAMGCWMIYHTEQKLKHGISNKGYADIQKQSHQQVGFYITIIRSKIGDGYSSFNSS